MSDSPVDTSVRIDPDEEITLEKKVILLYQWKEKVEAEIAEHAGNREKIMDNYKKLKEMYDHTLGIRTKKMRKFDVLINARKKVLDDIVKEIEIAKNEQANEQAGTTNIGGESIS